MSGHYMREYRNRGEGIEVLPAYGPLKAHTVAAKLTGKNKHKDMIRGFYLLSEAWYADANLKDRTDRVVDNISIGFFGKNGDAGTTGEFGVEWIKLGDNKIAPRLHVFDDAWDALAHFSDVLGEMVKMNNSNPTPVEFCVMLKRLGIKDLTPRKQP